MVKETLCKKVVEVRQVSHRVMMVAAAYEEDVLRLTCGHASQGEDVCLKKNSLFMMSLKMSGI